MINRGLLARASRVYTPAYAPNVTANGVLVQRVNRVYVHHDRLTPLRAHFRWKLPHEAIITRGLLSSVTRGYALAYALNVTASGILIQRVTPGYAHHDWVRPLRTHLHWKLPHETIPSVTSPLGLYNI